MMCACGQNRGWFVVKVRDNQVVIDSKCCITTIICSVECIEFSV